jgi:hypothetical protein
MTSASRPRSMPKGESIMSLVGKFFIEHATDSYCTGVVEEEVAVGTYLVRYDLMNKKLAADDPPPMMGARLASIETMQGTEFFNSRQDRDAFVAWFESPAKPDQPAKVLKLR